MSEQTKMIIVTSDPEIIEQFRFKQSQLTKVFIFHNEKLENSDFMNLTFAQLFQPVGFSKLKTRKKIVLNFLFRIQQTITCINELSIILKSTKINQQNLVKNRTK